MRFSPPAIAKACALSLVSSVSHSKRPDREVNPLSVSWAAEGKSALSAGKYDSAMDALETALAVDPRNREAFVTLAKVAQKQGLPGKAIRLYREALLIEPNDIVALSGQGEAMVERGSLARARDNLSRLAQLCPTACAEQRTLAAAIEKGSAAPVVSVQAVMPKPVVSEAVKP